MALTRCSGGAEFVQPTTMQHSGMPCGDAAMLRESAAQQGPFRAFVTQAAGLDANVTFVPAERLDPIAVRQA